MKILKKLYPALKGLFLVWSLAWAFILFLVTARLWINPILELAPLKTGWEHDVYLALIRAILITGIIWFVILFSRIRTVK